MSRRNSWMFVPGQSQKMVTKSLTVPADVIMLDLEDSVVPAQKSAARALVRQAIGQGEVGLRTPQPH